MRLAAIDIGSNSIHMVVVEADADGRGTFRVLDRERDMVRLGRSAHRDGALSDKAMARGLVTLHKMTTLAKLKGAERVVAVATSSVRESANGGEFLSRVHSETGLAVRVLSGEEEGRLIFRAVREAVDLGRGYAAVVDVGGGSTEWALAKAGELRRVVSLELGSLRLALTLRGRRRDDDPRPYGRAAIARLRKTIRASLRRIRPPKKLERLVATSGTAVCCADLVDFLAGRDWKAAAGVLREVRRRDLTALVDHLRRLRRDQVAALPPVGGPRSESILAGAVLLDEILELAGIDRFLVSDRALREGVVLDSLTGSEPPPPNAEVRLRQVQTLAERCPQVVAHCREVSRLAVRLFDLTRSVHALGDREREWLEYGALVHDIGYLVDYRKHHLHGYYLVTNAALDAFDPREIEIVAHLVRFHRGARPRAERHPSFAALKTWQQRTIERLVSILQLADALDRSHARRVRQVYGAISRKKVKLDVVSRVDITLELDALKKRRRLFEKLFEREVKATKVGRAPR
jgi:exopolyphosphatase/guanosine-5'-triphosphate,3'-diphosphate pyrophosphatase